MARIKVTCPNCGHQFWMEDYEKKACPKCGKVAIGPKSKPDSGGCFITEACVEAAGLPDDCLELQTLRHFRDSYLKETPQGRRMIQEYYQIAPIIVKRMKADKNSKEVFRQVFEDIRGAVALIQNKNPKQAIIQYRATVSQLREKYFRCSKSDENGIF
jgi:hypothetical protein